MKELVEKHWSYTKHAKFYEYRPNYAPKAIDILKNYIDKDGNIVERTISHMNLIVWG